MFFRRAVSGMFFSFPAGLCWPAEPQGGGIPSPWPMSWRALPSERCRYLKAHLPLFVGVVSTGNKVTVITSLLLATSPQPVGWFPCCVTEEERLKDAKAPAGVHFPILE